MPSSKAIIKYIDKYHNKAKVVRQIQSNIAESKRKWDIRHTLATIVLGAIFTFTGFMGTDRIFDTIFSEESSDSRVLDPIQTEQSVSDKNFNEKKVEDVSHVGHNAVNSDQRVVTEPTSSSLNAKKG